MESDAIKQEYLDHLRHMLGCTESTPKKSHGYRNRFCAAVGTEYHRDMTEMEKAGLVHSGCVINQGTCVYYHATLEGCKAINMSRSQIKRAMED